MKKICLVDVSAMYFRAFYAIRHLSNSKNMPTNALYGFLSMTAKILRDMKPEYVVYCFDRKDGSFRNEMYKEYKANRSEMPEELKPQVPYVRKLTEAMRLPAVDIKGYEADDVIGMFAKKAADENFEAIIVSGDKDFAQLISDKVKMYDPSKEVTYDPAKVEEKWGVRPDQFLDYLAIVGDSADNIPGVKGVGPKGASKMLSQFDTLDNIYENLDSISGKSVKAKMAEFKDMAYMSKDLVRIVTEYHTDLKDLESYKWQGPDFNELEKLLKELEFNNIGKRLAQDSKYIHGKSVDFEGASGSSGVGEAEDSSGLNLDISLVEKVKLENKDSKDLSGVLNQAKPVYLFLNGEFLCFAQDNEVFQVSASEFEESVVDLPKFKYIGHDLKSLWRSFGISNGIPVFDTMIAEYVLKSKNIGSFDKVWNENSGLELSQKSEEFYVSLKTYIDYIQPKISDANSLEAFQKVEMPVVKVLFEMEQRGIELSPDELKAQGEKLRTRVDDLRAEVFEATGEEDFNLDSPKQLGQVLFEKMKLPVVKKTKTGFSTNSDVLTKLSKKFPFCLKIIEYRELKKLLNTYIDSLPNLINTETKRIHTHFNQAVTATGRLSSTEPNLQNIPIRTEEGNAIRSAFHSEKGKLLVAADYSQIELRLLAHITDDAGLIKAFSEDRDIHSATAAEVFSVDFDKVDAEMRRQAKAVNFGIAYGMGAFSLAENLGIGRKDAKDIIDRYFNRFSGVQDYMSSIVEKAKSEGYVESIFGRRRYINELKSSNAILRKNGERIAINSPMQASASDIVKKAMLAVDELKDEAPMLLQVHDELIFEIDEDKVDNLVPILKEKMEQVVSLKVPLKVNVASADNWKEAH
ncbi:MAG: DNA polymerase I [Bdellovibrionales bacterium]